MQRNTGRLGGEKRGAGASLGAASGPECVPADQRRAGSGSGSPRRDAPAQASALSPPLSLPGLRRTPRRLAHFPAPLVLCARSEPTRIRTDTCCPTLVRGMQLHTSVLIALETVGSGSNELDCIRAIHTNPCNTTRKKKKKTHSLHTLLIPRCTYNTGAHRLAYYLDSVYRQTEPWASRPTHTHMNTKARTSQRTHSQKRTEDLNHKLTSMLLERSCSCSQHMHTPMGQGLRLVKIMPNGVISQF